ncbi:MAG TPA: excinuclease ABC subunit C, partial [Terriglobales bacterium]|nr:excinuclease ABC subunit C [Terriglobales bacterium]
ACALQYNLLVPAHSISFDPACDEEIFASLPAAPAVFALRGPDPASEPYVSKTANLRRRMIRLLSKPEEHSKRLNLRERVAIIEYSPTGSDFESGFLLYKTLRQEFPKTYGDRLRLRPAPLLRLILENEYPRISVTTRIGTLRGRSLYYGPFPTRAAAEKFSNDALDFFRLRRCTDDLNPDPAFPGCMYSEMKMCLAPCFKGCTDEQYRGETERVQEFFDTRGLSLRRELEHQREAASAELDFEKAAGIHARLEKLAPVLAQVDEIVTRIDRLNGVVIQPSADRDSVTLFRVEGGRLNGPIRFKVQENPAEGVMQGEEKSRSFDSAAKPGSAQDDNSLGSNTEKKSRPLSMEARFTDTLATAPPLEAGPAQEVMEHLAYLKRWHYRTNKIGEAFFTDEKGALPMRRIVRGISRVFRGERPSDLREVARDYWVNRGKAAELNPDNYNV